MSKFIHLFENISELDNSYTSYTLADSSKKLHETFLSSLGSEVESKDECIRQIFRNHPFFSVHCTDGDLLWRKYNDYLTVLGDNVLVSCDDSFNGEMVVPNNIVCICGECFYYCKSLSQFRLPKTLKYIGQNAFMCYKTITNIIYDGTITEWDSIIKGNKWFSKSNTNQALKVTCSDGVINVEN